MSQAALLECIAVLDMAIDNTEYACKTYWVLTEMHREYTGLYIDNWFDKNHPDRP